MMGLQPIFMLMMMFGGMGGNEVLDYVDTKVYWEIQGVEMTGEAMILEVKKPGVREGGGAKAKDVRRLMAIRTLGEMKEKKGVEVLREMLESEEMFVAGYAREGLGMIEGKVVDYPKTDAKVATDLALMPEGTGVVGSGTMQGGPAVDVRRMFKEMLESFGPDAAVEGDDALHEMQSGILEFVEEVGNVRIDRLVFGVAEEVNDEKGWVTISVRGKYDRQAVIAYMKKMAGDDLNTEVVDGVTYMMPDEEVRFGLVSDDHVIFMAGPNAEELPVEAVRKGLKLKGGKMQFGEALQELVNSTEKKGPMWFAGLVTGEMKEVDYLKEFSTFQFESSMKGGFLEMLLIGRGEDGLKVQQALADMEAMHGEFVKGELAEMKEAVGKAGEPLVACMEGLDFRGKGKTAIISTKMKEVNPISLISAITGMMFRGLEAQMEELEQAPAP